MRSKLAIVLILLLAAISPAAKKSSSSATTHVREYSRKDGTVVHAHERSKPVTSQKRTPVPEAAHKNVYCASCARNESGRIERSAAAKHSFEQQQPCPATGKTSGPCTGYVIDHVKPLACGGEDVASNMQWQTVAAAKAKDRTERVGCR